MEKIFIITMLFALVGCKTTEQKTKAKLNTYKIGHIELCDCTWLDIFNDLEKDSGIRFQLEMSETIKNYKFHECSPKSICIMFDDITLQEFLDNLKLMGFLYEVKGNTIIIKEEN